MSFGIYRKTGWGLVAALSLLLLFTGCTKPDATVILGNWRAESFAINSLRLPIAPSFEMTRNEMILKSPDGATLQKLPLSGIRAQGKNIEIKFRDGFGVSLVFIVESSDTVRFKVPLTLFDIVYKRV